MSAPRAARAEARETDAPVMFEGALLPGAEQEVRAGLSVAAYSFVLESYAVAKGDRVRRGDVIARLASPHAAIREAHERAMLHLLEGQLADARRAALKSQDPAAALGVTAAAHRVDQARAACEAHRRLLAGEEVRSPFDGVVAALPPLPRDAAGVVTVARVVALDPLLLEVSVPFADALPPKGARVECWAGAARRVARVKETAPFTDAWGLAVLVLEVPNPDPGLPAGLKVRGSVEVGSRRGVFVPGSALTPGQSGHTVRVPGPDGVTTRAVKVLSGDPREGDLEVAGLAEGESVLLRP